MTFTYIILGCLHSSNDNTANILQAGGSVPLWEKQSKKHDRWDDFNKLSLMPPHGEVKVINDLPKERKTDRQIYREHTHIHTHKRPEKKKENIKKSRMKQTNRLTANHSWTSNIIYSIANPLSYIHVGENIGIIAISILSIVYLTVDCPDLYHRYLF